MVYIATVLSYVIHTEWNLPDYEKKYGFDFTFIVFKVFSTSIYAFLPSGRGRSHTAPSLDCKPEEGSIIPLLLASNIRWFGWRCGLFSRTFLKTSGRQMMVYHSALKWPERPKNDAIIFCRYYALAPLSLSLSERTHCVDWRLYSASKQYMYPRFVGCYYLKHSIKKINISLHHLTCALFAGESNCVGSIDNTIFWHPDDRAGSFVFDSRLCLGMSEDRRRWCDCLL